MASKNRIGRQFNSILPGVSGDLFRLGKEISCLVPPHSVWRERNVIERCGFGNSPATVRCMINPYRKSERARTRHPPHSVWRGTGNWLECWLAPPSGGGGAHRGKFLPRPGEIGATEWRRGPTFDVKSLKMYVKTSFFDVEHEVKKDSFFVSAGIDIF